MKMKMICTTKRKSSRSIYMRYIWIFTFLLLITSITWVRGSNKSKKSDLNEEFRSIAKKMQEAYDDGDIDKVLKLFYEHCHKNDKMQPRLKPGKKRKKFKKIDEEIRAYIYRLAALSHDDLDQTGKRDIYLEKLINIKYHLESGIYRPSWRKIAEEKYLIAPRLLLGVKLGFNITIPHIYGRYSILESAASTGLDSYRKDYSSRLAHIWGAQLTGIIEYSLTKNFSLCIQPGITDMRFRYKNSLQWAGITEDYTHLHTLYYIEVPLILKYRFVNIESNFTPYLQIGGFFRIMQFAHKGIDYFLETESSTDEKSKDLNLKKLFSRTGSGFCVGAGIGYDIEIRGLIFRLEFETNYKHGFNNLVNENKRYENKELIFGYYDVFDDIKLRNFAISLKLLTSIYRKAFRR